MTQTALTIGKFAASAGVSVETVRFYQRKGLLKIPGSEGGVRRYGTEALRKLKFIRKAQEAGFMLSEIKELIQLDSSQDHERAYQLAMHRLEALEQKISDMQQARDSLKQLASDCACGGKTKPCAILAAFD
ncbi:MerR family transcriptional regulator [Methylophaga sp.]|uniref:MerR family transcriptional regulator n=1 Tax=Methylophaga sp. TaxID=2024840 RepID=UPI0014018A32|nr:MerR family transcriptional regulator [Methylophaga sp.]MTI63954.1 MerR family transcriptional regulator [Methylophaga sp.]